MIGIDLGTTNSLIAYWDEATGKPCLIPNALGDFLTPSAVSLDDSGAVLTGKAAWERRLTHQQRTAVAFKRDMGSKKTFRLADRNFLPEELSALILSSLKNDAQAFLKRDVNEVIISVPAYFNDTQRKATKAAAQIAGLTVLRLINEPTAAALAYGLGSAPEESKFLVFDLGGGTFDVSIVDQFEGVIEIKASTGDNYLGGEDFTAALIAPLLNKIQQIEPESKIAPSSTDAARLRGLADRFKCELSTNKEVKADFNLNEKLLPLTITEDEFEAACSPLLERLKTPVERAVRDARLKPSEISEVILVGGATRMPMVRKLATRLFGRFPNVTVHPDHAIALGAATQAALVARNEALNEVLLTDVCPYSLGIAVSESGIGNQVVHGIFSPIIERNVIVPVSRVNSYSTANDNQTTVQLEIFQGERRFCKDNIALGQLDVTVPPSKKGGISIEVRFTYDVSGLLEIDVTVPKTGAKFSKSLLGSASALNPEEIEERRLALNALKIHPREDLPNKATMARAERLYAELIGAAREQVGQALTQFALVLEGQDPIQIQKNRVQFDSWLDDVEKNM
jgi:molecular chaperone HscC